MRVHGGIGFMEDHDASILYRKARTDEFSFGDADFHRDIISRGLKVS